MASGITFPIQLVVGNEEREGSDFRNTRRSDTGDAYDDEGMLGSYQTNGGRPFSPPAGVEFRTAGYDPYGCSVADAHRGYVRPAMREDPAYDKDNYRERWSQPKQVDEDQGNRMVMPDDWRFRERNRRSRGFLTRPYPPIERG